MARRTSSLVGRQDALARLQGAAELASSSEPQIVLIEGEAGIGKSRLVAELTSGLISRGALLLFGSCPPIAGNDLPLAPVVQALRTLGRTLSAEEAEVVIGPSQGVLSVLVPALAAGGEPPQAGVSLGLVFEHILGVLERLTARRDLVVVVLDDIHWGGPSTWDLLAHLARNLISVPVLLIATYRQIALEDRAARIVTELRRSSVVQTIELETLNATQAGAIVLERRPGVSQAEVRAIVARAGGNPFHLEELVDAAGGRGVPETLRASLLARVEAQPEEVVRVVRAAAVIGRSVDANLLIKVVGHSEELTISALRQAVRGGLLVVAEQAVADDAAPNGYVFPHELLREIVYSSLVPGELARLHGAVARALTALPGTGDSAADRAIELATHWRESGDVIRAVPALLKAADAAQSAYAFVEAHRLYEQAFASMGTGAPDVPTPAIGFRPPANDRGPEWAELHARAAEAASLASEPLRAIDHIQAALGEPALKPASVLRWSERRARYLLEAGREAEALGAYGDLANRTGDGRPADRPRLFVAYSRALTVAGRFREAGEMAEAALRLARNLGLPSEEWQALNLVGTSLAFAGQSEKGLAALTEARRLSQAHLTDSMVHPRPSRIGEILGGQLTAALALDRVGLGKQALDLTLQGAKMADRLGATRWREELEVAASWQLFHQGRWADALTRYDERLANVRQPSAGLGDFHVVRARIGAAQGRWADAEADLAAAELTVARTSSSALVVEYYLALAEIAFGRRRLLEAAAVIDDALGRLGDSEDRRARGELCVFALRVEVELGAEARMRRASSERERHDEASARYLAEGRALLHADDGTAKDPRDAAILALGEAEFSRLDAPDAATWSTAVTAWESVGDPYVTAYARWRLSEALLSGGGVSGRSRAGDELRIAFHEATALDATPLRSEIESLATRARVALNIAPSDEPGVVVHAGSELGLSPRELEVLALVSHGRTNRQIAEALFITEKTAGHHVSNILSKLGVANRLEAASIAHRAGIELKPAAY